MLRWKIPAVAVALFALFGRAAIAQDHSAARLQELVRGITVTPRVLTIGAHPDDDDPDLIAWLARGHMVETGYLSLTRGESGQNFLSADVGTFLGAVRTGESIAARRIDGGRQFFARAYDFGVARNAEDAFKHWPHDSLLADVVTVIRSFRPQVLVVAFNDSILDGDGQHAAANMLARDAFAAASDTIRFPVLAYGAAWWPLKLYQHGGTLRIDAAQFDPLLGKTYADLAVESRSQHRSQGLSRSAISPSPIVLLDRVAGGSPGAERSIFDDVDTSFARLVPGSFSPASSVMRDIATYADSANRALDVAHPERVVGFLAKAARLASEARANIPRCLHPTAATALPAREEHRCDPVTLDRDASIDLIEERVNEALLLAAGVDIQATTDREFIATKDTVIVNITLRNRGRSPVTLGDISVNGMFNSPAQPIVVAPDSVGRAFAIIDSMPDSRPWWFGVRLQDLFAASPISVDGLTRSSAVPVGPTIPGVAMPEEMRRVSDLTVSMIVAGAPITTSSGPIVFRYANPLIGVQDRPVSGSPAVTLSFPRALEWVVAHKRIDRTERLSLESFSDHAKRFKLQLVTPAGVHVEAAPESVTVDSHETRELFLHVRGILDSGRVAFGAAGKGPGGVYAGLYIEGFQAVEYPHIQPIRVFHSSGFWLQTVDVEVPPHLAVAYVPGPGDDMALSLRDIGMTVITFTPDELPAADLSFYKTLIIGPRAFDAYPALVAQHARILDFAREGGTVVMLQEESPLSVVPFSVGPRFPRERVTSPAAAVTVLDPKARLLNWPNRITEADWKGWSVDRASFVPTSVDAHYATYIETHDPQEPANRNALITAPLGKGTFVYTTLSLHQQVRLGVGGGLRLLVNMICAGLPMEPRR